MFCQSHVSLSKIWNQTFALNLTQHSWSSVIVVAVFRFCQQVSLQEYERQREQATMESLKQLIQHISSSTTLSVKEKKRLVKDFQKHHPGPFLQHFSSTF